MNAKYTGLILSAIVCIFAGCRTQPAESVEPCVLSISLTGSGDSLEVHCSGDLVSWGRLTRRLIRLREEYPKEPESLVIGLTVSRDATAADLNELLALLASHGYRRVALLSPDASETSHYLHLHINRVATSHETAPFTFSEGAWILKPIPDDSEQIYEASLKIVRTYSMTEDAQLYKTPRVPWRIRRDETDAYTEGYRVGWFDVGSRTVLYLSGDGELGSAYAPMCVDVSQKSDVFKRGYKDGCRRAVADLRRYEAQIRKEIKKDQNNQIQLTK